MRHGINRNLSLLAAAATLFLAPLAVLASGGGLVTAPSASAATSSTTVTLLVPGVIGIDIETDVTFDMTLLDTASAPNVCQNVFPPGSSCASAVFTPSSISTTSGAAPAPEFTAPTTGAGSGAIYLSLFDSTAGSVATKHVTNVIPAAWSGTTPGIATSALKTQKAGSNNGGLGNTAWASIPTTAANMGNVSSIANGSFNWTRQDQDFELVVPSTQNYSATADASVIVTYVFSRS
jgi:hypothetical protein